jgi:hypothetical protein
MEEQRDPKKSCRRKTRGKKAEGEGGLIILKMI